MKGVKLTENIRYIHCDNPDGDNHGVLLFFGSNGQPERTWEVNTQEDFRAGYEDMLKLEKSLFIRELVTA